MDKKIFLIKKGSALSSKSWTEGELEELVSRDDYFYNDDIIKIEGDEYNSLEECLESECDDFDLGVFLIFDFGF